MNQHKLAWYLRSQISNRRISESVESVTLIHKGKKKKYTKSDNKYKIAKEQYWDNFTYNPKNLWETYQSPAGQIYTDVVFGLTMPAVMIGRKAKKIIEIMRATGDILNND